MVHGDTQANLTINDYKTNNLLGLFTSYIYVVSAFLVYFMMPTEYRSTYVFYVIVILGSTFFAALASQSKSSLMFDVNLFFSFLILFFVLGFRNYSGIDDDSYIRIFYEVSNQGWLSRFMQTTMEPGYLMLNAAVSLFTDNYIYMQLLSSLIPLSLFFFVFKRHKKDINLPMAVFLLSTILYFQVLSVGLVRMFIAIGIVFFSFYYLSRNETKKYVTIIIIASLFHYSALFMLTLTYISNKKSWENNRYKKFILLAVIFTPMVFFIISYLFIPFMGARYAIYGNIDDVNFSLSSLSTLPLLFFLLLHNNNKEIKKITSLFITIFALNSILSFYGSILPMGRLIFYTNIALFIVAPMISRYLKKDLWKLIFNGAIILYAYLYVYRTQFTLESHIPNLFPYQNIFY
ncbi:EpsG family protein [Halobacillus litoralis]|uniref:EpsG family protein n=1 Tax=Halobacillus litoralis TaxID=45668 RepID=UPI001CFEAB61|nr:EpsG family protein [Halobacillus litoralis]WLR49053.1 EpsG family protein [Halobacillus litoralis]